MFVLDIMLIATGLVGVGSEAIPADPFLKKVVEDFESQDRGAAGAATVELFNGGRKSINYLIAKFSNESKFIGTCNWGRVSCKAIPYRPGMFPAEYTVREASLYILVAIFRNEMHFGDSCRVEQG